MQAVGAKQMTVAKIIITQTLTILLTSTLSGTSIGLVLTFLFLIPEPTISTASILHFVGLLALSIITITLLSFYPILKTTKKPISKAIQSS